MDKNFQDFQLQLNLFFDSQPNFLACTFLIPKTFICIQYGANFIHPVAEPRGATSELSVLGDFIVPHWVQATQPLFPVAVHCRYHVGSPVVCSVLGERISSHTKSFHVVQAELNTKFYKCFSHV